MEKLIKRLKLLYPQLSYREGKVFYWSPETKEVFYAVKLKDKSSIWSLLHETSHALLNHSSYKTDFELLSMEVAAWERAKALGSEFDLVVDEDHIQDCLDTYRDWLYARSICPNCSNKSLQHSDLRHYQCFNCHAIWKVTPSRFCRAYRSVKSTPKPSIIFHASIDL